MEDIYSIEGVKHRDKKTVLKASSARIYTSYIKAVWCGKGFFKWQDSVLDIESRWAPKVHGAKRARKKYLKKAFSYYILPKKGNESVSVSYLKNFKKIYFGKMWRITKCMTDWLRRGY